MATQEHHEGIMLSAIAHISGQVILISVRPRLSPMLQPLLSEACPHSQNRIYNGLKTTEVSLSAQLGKMAQVLLNQMEGRALDLNAH